MRARGRGLMAWIGPAISQPNFEVGDEVRAAFVEAIADAGGYFTGNRRLTGCATWADSPSTYCGAAVNAVRTIGIVPIAMPNVLFLSATRHHRAHGGVDLDQISNDYRSLKNNQQILHNPIDFNV